MINWLLLTVIAVLRGVLWLLQLLIKGWSMLAIQSKAPPELPPNEPPPAKKPVQAITAHPVSIQLAFDRRAVCGDETFVIPAEAQLKGELTVRPSGGPIGEREEGYPPRFFKLTFDFQWQGSLCRYRGFLSQYDLCAENGTLVKLDSEGFRDDSGPLERITHKQLEWFYVCPDGQIQTVSIMYISWLFGVMVESLDLLIRCEYYHPDKGKYMVIYYKKALADLLLLNETEYSCDERGNIEDWNVHRGEVVRLERRCV